MRKRAQETSRRRRSRFARLSAQIPYAIPPFPISPMRTPLLPDHAMHGYRMNLPIVLAIATGDSRTTDSRGNAHAIEPREQSQQAQQARFDVAQARAIWQRRECHDPQSSVAEDRKRFSRLGGTQKSANRQLFSAGGTTRTASSTCLWLSSGGGSTRSPELSLCPSDRHLPSSLGPAVNASSQRVRDFTVPMESQ